ncbi:MAG TPA: SDR family NAD(P)-dependent oxidoreductase [Myxococcaceae bacterium]|nr:SDR family NAD(P)-dependent oxidoreductase [Myxococcaceae bacterium]
MSSSLKAVRFRERYGPWAVVTGASDGIGRDFAHRLAEAGVHLVLVARRAGLLETLAAELSRSHGVSTRILPMDLSQPGAAEALSSGTSDLDVGLVVAAAGFGTSGPFLAADMARELDMVQLNCAVVTELAHRFGRRIAGRGRGGLVLMSSLLAFQGVPRAATYAATKAYVQTLAEALHVELAPAGVDVVACAPGPVKSGFEGRAGMQMGIGLPASAVGRATLAALGKRTTVRPGWLSKALELALASLLTRWARVRMMARVMRGMTAHQDMGSSPVSG